MLIILKVLKIILIYYNNIFKFILNNIFYNILKYILF